MRLPVSNAMIVQSLLAQGKFPGCCHWFRDGLSVEHPGWTWKDWQAEQLVWRSSRCISRSSRAEPMLRRDGEWLWMVVREGAEMACAVQFITTVEASVGGLHSARRIDGAAELNEHPG